MYRLEHVQKMMSAKIKLRDYPNKRLLRFDRVDVQGEIYHPYAAEKEDDNWIILVYLPLTEDFQRIKESIFLSLSISTEKDLFERKN